MQHTRTTNGMCKVKKPASLIVITTLLFVMGGTHSHAISPIDVGSHKQLFIDDLFFATLEGISLKIRPPRKTGEAILRPEHPWESATLNWFSVLEDAGKYRMWYEAYDVDGWPTSNDTSFCYAESRDAIHWTKPKLGLFSYQGGTRNNILFRQVGSEGAHSRVHGACVFIDPSAPASSRYKAVSQGMFPAPPDYRIAGMLSHDGLNWTRFSQPICNLFADSQYSGFWDSTLGKYVLYGRVSGQGRSLGRSESSDFTHFDPLKLVLETDDKDPPNSDLYNSAAMKYPYAKNIYLMFPSLYQHEPETLDIRLAVSRDGIRWTRPDRETPWIALGQPDDFDRGSLYMGQGVIQMDDELWFYYSGSPLRHNEAELKNLTQPKNARVYSRVVTRLDRFIAAVPSDGGGTFTTPPLRFTGKILKLNVKVQQSGSVRVGLLDEQSRPIPGRSVEDCIPIVGDSLRATVQWKGGSDVSFRENKPTRLQVEMTDAELYSFQTLSRKSGEIPVRVIFDTDIVGDVDDVGAVAVLHALADQEEAQILAMGVSAKNPNCAPCLDALNTYFGRPDIPIGVVKGKALQRDSKYNSQIARGFPNDLRSAKQIDDAAEVYRRILAKQPDHSVVFISVGQLTNLRNLLYTLPDQWSNLDGVSLVRQKVKAWVCMGGKFPQGKEANFINDGAAAADAVAHWPTRIVFSGYEVGVKVNTGTGLHSLPESSPVRRAYVLFNGLTNRNSWDQTAVVYGVRGLQDGDQKIWDVENSGTCHVFSDGSNLWRQSPDKQHAYLKEKMPPDQVAALIEALMKHQPN